jgi:hypothetical protein
LKAHDAGAMKNTATIQQKPWTFSQNSTTFRRKSPCFPPPLGVVEREATASAAFVGEKRVEIRKDSAVRAWEKAIACVDACAEWKKAVKFCRVRSFLSTFAHVRPLSQRGRG